VRYLVFELQDLLARGPINHFPITPSFLPSAKTILQLLHQFGEPVRLNQQNSISVLTVVKNPPIPFFSHYLIYHLNFPKNPPGKWSLTKVFYSVNATLGRNGHSNQVSRVRVLERSLCCIRLDSCVDLRASLLFLHSLRKMEDSYCGFGLQIGKFSVLLTYLPLLLSGPVWSWRREGREKICEV